MNSEDIKLILDSVRTTSQGKISLSQFRGLFEKNGLDPGPPPSPGESPHTQATGGILIKPTTAPGDLEKTKKIRYS